MHVCERCFVELSRKDRRRRASSAGDSPCLGGVSCQAAKSPTYRAASGRQCSGRCHHCGKNVCMWRCKHVSKHVCKWCFVSLSWDRRRLNRIGRPVPFVPNRGGEKKFLELFSGSGHLANAFAERGVPVECWDIIHGSQYDLSRVATQYNIMQAIVEGSFSWFT